MDILTEIKYKIKRKRAILFDKDSLFLQELQFELNKQSRKVVILWALELAQESVNELQATYPNDSRPQNAVNLARLWARGDVKMPIAKRAILNCHAMAKELNDKSEIALCHAIAQACSVVHTVGHAMGYPLYELTALVHRYGVDNCYNALLARKFEYLKKLNFCENNINVLCTKWANFIDE